MPYYSGEPGESLYSTGSGTMESQQRRWMLLVAAWMPSLTVVGGTPGMSTFTVSSGDLILSPGASIIPGHGSPTGQSLRTGSPGQTTDASFPRGLVIVPGCTVKSVAMDYRYVTGYEKEPSGMGVNLMLSISDEADSNTGTVLYKSPLLNQYSYSLNESNYSAPVPIRWGGSVAIPSAAAGTGSRLKLGFQNNDRNLQLVVPFSVTVTCDGAEHCLAAPPAPKPTPPPSPLPPAPPPPPKSNEPWAVIGPHNVGDDGFGRGEAGTIAPAVSVIGNPDLIYMGGNNNAAASGVLKSTDYGKHWSKMNTGLFDTRLLGLHIVDDKGDHVLAGTPSGVFETLDGAKTWTYVTQTAGHGVASSFRNGTILGKPVIFVGTSAGLINVPVVKDGPMINETWSMIPSPRGSAAWRTNVVSLADFDEEGKPLHNSVVVGCLWVGGHGVVHIASVINETAASWVVQQDQPCQSMAIDPNNAAHLVVNNASNGAHIYESWDGGQSYHSCLDRRGAVMVAIDRRGWFYTGSEAGAFVNQHGGRDACTNGSWQVYYDVRREWRRANITRTRSAHDYQRISIDFAGRVAFGSDQGMFIQPNGTSLELYSVNSDTLNNNIIMHPAIAEGDVPGETCIVTALWDWSPVASWDSGKHWPSWQIADDGAGMTYFGEGGGCFAMGKSQHVLCMHHHDVAYSERCGKNMSRFVAPRGASVLPHVFERVEGSREVPSGVVYAPMYMGEPPYQTLADKAIICDNSTMRYDLGVVNRSYSCLSQADFGGEYGKYKDFNVAVWRGDTDEHCYLCKLSGEPSSWKMQNAKGAFVFALEAGYKHGSGLPPDMNSRAKPDADGIYAEGGAAAERRAQHKFESHVRKQGILERGEELPIPTSGFEDGGNGNPLWILKSWNFGATWTYIKLPEYLQGGVSLVVDPTNATTLYGITGTCVTRSYDQAETWTPCWVAPGLTGSFKELLIRDSMMMIMMRNGNVPLRTYDGGVSWKPLNSISGIVQHGPSASFSWSGKTLGMNFNDGGIRVWVSSDDGDTWIDESSDYTALTGGIAQWYENTLYVCSLGQGISAKVFEEFP